MVIDPAELEVYDDDLFEIDLLVKHPTMRLDAISRELGLMPSYTCSSDEVWSATARDVPSMQRPRTAWRHTFLSRSRDIGSALDCLLGDLEQHRAVFLRIAEGGGTSDLVVRFPCSKCCGFNISAQAVETIARCGLEFGVEVYPDWYPEE